jgi:hypothetical protein
VSVFDHDRPSTASCVKCVRKLRSSVPNTPAVAGTRGGGCTAWNRSTSRQNSLGCNVQASRTCSQLLLLNCWRRTTSSI